MTRTKIGKAVLIGLFLAAFCVGHGAWGATVSYLQKVDATPDYTQTDLAYGGFPDPNPPYEDHGGVFCGPTATSNALMWLDENGYPNLVPNTADRKKDQHDLIATIASAQYMNAYDGDGANPTNLCQGLADYIDARGYNNSYTLQYQGWRSIPAEFDTGVDVVNVNWARTGIQSEASVELWNVGWYDYDSQAKTYTRVGGHWVTMVGYEFDASDYNPNYFVIHDPSPRCGTEFRNEYVQSALADQSAQLVGDNSGLPRSASGHRTLSGWPISSSGDTAILDCVVVLTMAIPDNYAPVAVNDPAAEYAAYYAGNKVNPLNVGALVGVLGNDTDRDHDPLTSVKLSNPAHGTVTLSGNGSFQYTPSANYHGSDSFTYQAYDGDLYSDPATVTLQIASVNDAPVAVGDSYSVAKGSSRVVYSWEGVLVNDTDADNTDSDPNNNTTLSAVLGTSTSHGSLSLYGNGAFAYTPLADFWGTDSFTYKAYDGGAYSDMTTVLLEVYRPVQVSGDATGDGMVDQADAAVLAAHWGNSGATWTTGDFSGDGVVSAADASILAANWGAGAGEAGGTSAPEPSILALLVGVSLTSCLVRRRDGRCRR
jgi:VCBS repeat-containing protein